MRRTADGTLFLFGFEKMELLCGSDKKKKDLPVGSVIRFILWLNSRKWKCLMLTTFFWKALQRHYLPCLWALALKLKIKTHKKNASFIYVFGRNNMYV